MEALVHQASGGGIHTDIDSCGEPKTAVVVGGGAAGVYGAIWAKTACPELKVHVLERGQFLSKVKVSGGGRCNVTTGLFVDPLPLSQQYPRGHRELRGAYFRTHGPRETIAWFKEHGVQLKTEEDGRMFPTTDDSGTVVTCLLNEARRLGVVLQSRVLVTEVTSLDGKFEIEYKERNKDILTHISAEFTLLATGSSSQGYAIASKLGHKLVHPVPSLFTFKVDDDKLNQLAGVSFEHVSLKLEISDCKSKFTADGPLLVTHWGLSGPAILRLSAWAAKELHTASYKGTLFVDYAPELTIDELAKSLVNQKVLSPRRKLETVAPHMLQLGRRAWQYLLERQGVNEGNEWCRTSNKVLHELANLLKRCPFHVSGKGEYKDEFVTAGGVSLEEVNLKTMESRICPRLYFAGELLNVDGITGGFNFQNAWTSGYISGTAMAAHSREYLSFNTIN